MFIEPLFIISKECIQSKCLSTKEWINEMCYINAIECYLAVRWNEVVIYDTTQMNLENFVK